MTPELQTMLEQWLVSGTDIQQRHAAWRLSLPDEVNGIASYPSLATMAGNAIKAVAGFVADGFKVASEEEQSRRLAICHQCPKYDATQDRCFICGCVASWKARIASQHCPLETPRW